MIDDGHLLGADDVERLVEWIEDAPSASRLIVAGRILSDFLHEAAHLVDGLIIDADAMAIGPEEVLGELRRRR